MKKRKSFKVEGDFKVNGSKMIKPNSEKSKTKTKAFVEKYKDKIFVSKKEEEIKIKTFRESDNKILAESINSEKDKEIIISLRQLRHDRWHYKK